MVLLTNNVAISPGGSQPISFLLRVDGVSQNERFQLVLTLTRDTSVFDKFRNTLDGIIFNSDGK